MEDQPQKTRLDLNWADQLILTTMVLAFFLAMPEVTQLDFHIASQFFDGESWLIEAKDPMWRYAFYILPKWSLILFASAMILLLLLSIKVRALKRFRTRTQIYIILCAVMIPLAVGLGKKVTDVYCPYQLEQFGGPQKYQTRFFAYNTEDKGSCFPAGHASGGFALLMFVPLARSRKQFAIALTGALAVGWLTGGYQMLNGRHFLSHTVVTMLLAWMIVVINYVLILKKAKEPECIEIEKRA